MKPFNIYQAAMKRVKAKTNSDEDTLIVNQWSAMIELNRRNKALTAQLDELKRNAAEASFASDIAASRANKGVTMQTLLQKH